MGQCLCPSQQHPGGQNDGESQTGRPALSQKADSNPCRQSGRKGILCWDLGLAGEMEGWEGLGRGPLGSLLMQEFSTCVPTGCMNVGACPLPAEPKCVPRLHLEVEVWSLKGRSLEGFPGLRQEPQGTSDFRLRSQGPCTLFFHYGIYFL